MADLTTKTLLAPGRPRAYTNDVTRWRLEKGFVFAFALALWVPIFLLCRHAWIDGRDPAMFIFCGMAILLGVIFLLIPFQLHEHSERIAQALGLEIFGFLGSRPSMRGAYKGFPVLVRRWAEGGGNTYNRGGFADSFLTSISVQLRRPASFHLSAGESAKRHQPVSGMEPIVVPEAGGLEVYGKPAGLAREFCARNAGALPCPRLPKDERPLTGDPNLDRFIVSGDRLEIVFMEHSPLGATTLTRLLDYAVGAAESF